MERRVKSRIFNQIRSQHAFRIDSLLPAVGTLSVTTVAKISTLFYDALQVILFN